MLQCRKNTFTLRKFSFKPIWYSFLTHRLCVVFSTTLYLYSYSSTLYCNCQIALALVLNVMALALLSAALALWFMALDCVALLTQSVLTQASR